MDPAKMDFAEALLLALGNDRRLVAVQSKLFYQRRHVKRYNQAILDTPIAITYPRTAQQVAAIIRSAQDAGVKVQPRSGGHSFGNYSLGGVHDTVVIDLKHFQKFYMNRTTWRATVGAGTRLGDLSRRLHKNGGRTIAHGTCPKVGIGGHATIGGIGPLSRLWGTCLDHIEEVEVVTADGTIKRASLTENSDLFWALRGAGSSFGVITEFVFMTRPEPGRAVQFSYTFEQRPYTSMASMFRKWLAFVLQEDLTRKFASSVIFSKAGMIISGTYYGSRAEYDALQLDSKFPGCRSMKTIAFYDCFAWWIHFTEERVRDLFTRASSPFYAKSLLFSEDDAHLILEKTVDQFLKYLDDTPKGTPVWFVMFDLAGGAVNDISSDATAYAHRDSLIFSHSYGISFSLNGRISETLKSFLENLNKIFTDGTDAGIDLGVYPGYVDPGLKNGPEGYWRHNLARLQQIKLNLDPGDIFQNPQSVKPISSAVKDAPFDEAIQGNG